jgi:hypothetical protein
LIRSDGSLWLRAERSGMGRRRVCTVTCKATDAAGNMGVQSVDIVVPHDEGTH